MALPPVYKLYYWPHLPGRGELVRLAFAEAGFDLEDVARESDDAGGGFASVVAFLKGTAPGHPAFAPPVLVVERPGVEDLVLAQTPAILAWIGDKMGLCPRGDGQWHALQLALTASDLMSEAHDTHHPVSASLYYEDQKAPAREAARLFVAQRLPRFFGYFERVLAFSGGPWLLGEDFSYADLALFQALEGVAYAFPHGFAATTADTPRLVDHRTAVAARPRIAAYLASDRRMAFNLDGIFRHYPELETGADADAPTERA